ncbi:hypothetical protein [Flexithrix dorotheae]|uniref:hypothetical protein n=1 Tax=Flexithrix dorotheae TaxID=70993 RepID=UPI0003720B05|nr:hypothetical protein [Flexithrix dorotheae]
MMNYSMNKLTQQTFFIHKVQSQEVSSLIIWMIIALFMMGCSSSQDEQLNIQGIEIHNKAMKKGGEMEQKMQKIQQFSESVDPSLQSAFLDSVKVLEEDFSTWKANIVEVPGNEHDHHDHEGHDHHHEPNPELTPQMVLEIQQFMLVEIEKLNVRAAQIIIDFKEE